MKNITVWVIAVLLMVACSNEPEAPVKYHFSSEDEFNKYYLPLQDKHGGVKSFVPSPDADCPGGKIFTHGDGFQSTWCPKDGNNDLFKWIYR